MERKVLVSVRALSTVLKEHGVRARLPRRQFVLVTEGDVYRIAAKIVARRYGLRKIYRFRGHQPIFSHRNLNRLTGGLLTEFFCVSRRLVGKTAGEVAASEALERLSPEHREEVRRRLTEFSAEVESLARTLWGALSKAASNQESASLGTPDTTERAPQGGTKKLLSAIREALGDEKVSGVVKSKLWEVVEYIRRFEGYWEEY